MGYDLLSFFPQLEKLSASLCYKDNGITKLSLVKYKGAFYKSGSHIIDLNDLFDFVEDFSFLSHLTRLEKFHLYNTETPVTLVQLSYLTNLKHLTLFRLDFSIYCVLSSRMLNNLEYLRIDTFTDVDRDIMKIFFSQLINLKELYLHVFDGSYLKFIPNGLLKLRIGGGNWFSLSYIQHLTSLE